MADLESIANYLEQANPNAAKSVISSIAETLDILRLFPDLGRSQTESGVRKIITRRYRYLVYYRIAHDAEEIHVLTVQHPSRRRTFQDA